MSRAERLAYAEQLGQEIRDDEHKYKQLCLEIEKLQSGGADGMVYSTINGTVSVLNPKAGNYDTLVEIKGKGGAHIICILGETELLKYPVGTEIIGFSYDTGNQVKTRVSYISPMPVTSNYSNGGNPNSSGYMVQLEVTDGTDLPLGSYLEFTQNIRLSDTGTVYLYEAFVREIDGKDYIFVDRNGILSQEQVFTGRRVYEYIELIGCNLTQKDYIAFPYDKAVHDGAVTEIKEDIW